MNIKGQIQFVVRLKADKEKEAAKGGNNRMDAVFLAEEAEALGEVMESLTILRDYQQSSLRILAHGVDD